MGVNYNNTNTSELIRDLPKLKPRIIEYNDITTLINQIIDLVNKFDTKFLGSSIIGFYPNEQPTKQDLKEAGIMKDANLILFIRIDKSNVRQTSAGIAEQHNTTVQDQVNIYRNDYTEYGAFFLRKE